MNEEPCYFVDRGGEFLIEKEDGIAWSKYMVDATIYDTDEEAESARWKYGLSMCGVSSRSSRKFVTNMDLLPPVEQRIIPGEIGHHTGGKVYCLLDVLYKIADNYEKNQKSA